MDKRAILKERIDKIAKESFNNEQKEIAKKIIDNTAEEDLDAVWSLISQRVKTGFVFDSAPEINHNCISYVKENKKLGINLDKSDALEHSFIIGENYDALKNLLATYTDKQGRGLINVIYIDPPYNTDKSKAEGNDYKEEIVGKSKFIYRDKYTRDGWLNMMNERLKLAKKLLADDGVIFISIDDSEQAYLKVLCDEIFGENAFLLNVARITKKGGKSTQTIAKNNDYIIGYTVSNDIKFSQEDKTDLSKYKYEDEFVETRGKYALTQTLDYNSLQYSPTMDFEIEIDGKKFYPGGLKEIMEQRHNGHHGITDWVWRWSKSAVQWGMENNMFVVKNGRVYTKSYLNCRKKNGKNELEMIDATKSYTTLSYMVNRYSNDNGKKELDSIFKDGSTLFKNPKPSTLIFELIKMVCPNKSALILDFFAGSGTTGQAVMELNEEDGGKRKFILVTNNENNIALNVTRERLYRVINGKGSKGEEITWEYSKDKKSLINNSVRVFDLVKQELNITDIEKAEKIKIEAEENFKKLNPKYIESDNLNIYNDLASLTPYKDESED